MDVPDEDERHDADCAQRGDGNDPSWSAHFVGVVVRFVVVALARE